MQFVEVMDKEALTKSTQCLQMDIIKGGQLEWQE